MNSFTGIFRQHFKFPHALLMYWLKPPPSHHKILKSPPMFSTPVGNPPFSQQFTNSLGILLGYNFCENYFSQNQKRCIKQYYMFHEILLMKIMFFLCFFFAKLGEIREIHGNRSPWLKVKDTVNGMYLFTIRVIIFHCSILPLRTWIQFCFFFLLEGIQNTSKMLQRFFSSKVSRVIKIVFSKENFRNSCRVCICVCNIYL